MYIGMQQILTRIGDKAKVSSVLLLTDGQANEGPSSMESILDAMKNPMAYDMQQSSSGPNMAYGMQQSSSHPNMPNSKPRHRFNPFGVSKFLHVFIKLIFGHISFGPFNCSILMYSKYSLICSKHVEIDGFGEIATYTLLIMHCIYLASGNCGQKCLVDKQWQINEKSPNFQAELN